MSKEKRYPSAVGDALGRLPRLLLTESEAAAAIGLTPRFLQNRRHRGDGPPFVQISSRCIRYEPEALRAWAARHRRMSTSDSGTKGDQ
jgi:hypothetical protein